MRWRCSESVPATLAPITAVLVAAALFGCSREAVRPNLLLISLDSTRHDMLGAYGFDAPHAPGVSPTPHLDRLAAEGALFENAHSTTSWTLPSHLAILTGQHDLVHAVELPDFRLSDVQLTLAQRLGAEGYRTSGFYSGPYLDPQFGFARGFERYADCYGKALRTAADRAARTARRVAKLAGREIDPEYVEAWASDVKAQQALEVASQRDVSSVAVADAVVEELGLAAADERPFFVFAHLFDPHYDYVPPTPFERRFDPSYGGAVDGRDFFRNPAVSVPDPEQPSGRRRTIGARDLEHVRALYAGEVAATDAAVGRVLARLEELGLADSTLVVVLSDHGDEFFEHGGIGHRRTLFDEVTHVPLLVRMPGVVAPGTRVAQSVSTSDVFPTALELLGLPRAGELHSVSLGPWLRAATGGAGRQRPGVLARLVRTWPAEVRVQSAEGTRSVPVDRVFVTETFRAGSLKITRDCWWNRPPPNIDGELLTLLRDEERRRRGLEDLRWIDLGVSPEEAPEAHSADFSAPGARAALQAFHDRYRELLADRARVGTGSTDSATAARLRGLGYQDGDFSTGGGDAGGAPGGLSSDVVVLPPPGRALLGRDR